MDHLKPLLPHTSCLPQTKKKSNVEHCDKNESHALGKEDGLTCRALGKGRAYVSCLGKGTGLRVLPWERDGLTCRALGKGRAYVSALISHTGNTKPAHVDTAIPGLRRASDVYHAIEGISSN